MNFTSYVPSARLSQRFGRRYRLGALGVRGRLLAGFMAVALFTGGLGLFAVLAMGAVTEGQTVMYVDEFGGLDLFAQYVQQTYECRTNVLAYLLTDEPDRRQLLRDQIARGDARMMALEAQMDAADLDRRDVDRLAGMTAAWDAYAQWRDQVVLGSGESDKAGTIAGYYADGASLMDTFTDASNLFLQQKRDAAAELDTSANTTYDLTRTLAIALSVGAVALALGIGFFVSRSISRAVGDVGLVASKLAVGELDQQLEVRSQDEIGRMADAFRAMVCYQQQMATVATAIAEGDLSLDIEPKSSSDALGTAFQRMSRNLRAMVGELEKQTATLGAQAQLLELAHDAIVVRDPETAIIRFWNGGAEELYGWNHAEAIGKETHSLLGTEFPQSRGMADNELARTGRWDGELIHTRKDGTRISVASRQSVQRDGSDRPVAVLEINTDVTHRLEAEAALALARDVAEAASQAKSDFLANTSHEIRTPMNAILGMAELLAETPLNDEQREYVRTFQRAGDTLLTLINDVLDLSKVEAGQLELEQIPFELDDLVEQTAEVLAVRAHAKGLELTVHVLPDVRTHVLGDPTRLRQVLTNLVGNAIKFTEIGEVSLRVEMDPQGPVSSSVSFTVQDTGIGIPDDKLTQIFSSFVQVDTSTTRRYGGTGLGLAISARIVELMGGRIVASSQLGKSSTFTFSIPLEPIARTQPRRTSPTVDIHGWRVLVTDDNATNRLILRQFLTGQGALVVEARTGEEALAAMYGAREQRQPFRLLLLDARMPGMDGFQVAASLREEVGMLAETVVMLTSDSRTGDVARARQLGLAAYMVKPIKRAELIQTIVTVASRKGAVEGVTVPEVAAAFSEAVARERPLRLLLVEDSPDNRVLIQAYLKKLPYHIDIAEDGQAGVARVREQEYDLVLMDMFMPVMDGLEATRAIRAWERAEGRQSTPVVALTANAMKDDVRHCLEAGCDAHVAKPVKKAALLASITRYAKAPLKRV